MKSGTLLVVLSFLTWGLLPLYWKEVTWVPAVEMVFWRLIFTVLSCLIAFPFLKSHNLEFSWKSNALVVFMGTLVALNWGSFIWAVQQGYVIQSSLAYFLCPLLSVMLGFIVLRESLSPAKFFSVGVAVFATTYYFFSVSEPPYAAVIMAVTFAIYGLIKKRQNLGPVPALLGEALWGACLVYFWVDDFTILQSSIKDVILVSLSGPATLLPLILFAYGAKQIELQKVGILQYIVPFSHFSLAVGVFGEPFDTETAVSFSLIWVAVLIFFLGEKRIPLFKPLFYKSRA